MDVGTGYISSGSGFSAPINPMACSNDLTGGLPSQQQFQVQNQYQPNTILSQNLNSGYPINGNNFQNVGAQYQPNNAGYVTTTLDNVIVNINDQLSGLFTLWGTNMRKVEALVRNIENKVDGHSGEIKDRLSRVDDRLDKVDDGLGKVVDILENVDDRLGKVEDTLSKGLTESLINSTGELRVPVASNFPGNVQQNIDMTAERDVVASVPCRENPENVAPPIDLLQNTADILRPETMSATSSSANRSSASFQVIYVSESLANNHANQITAPAATNPGPELLPPTEQGYGNVTSGNVPENVPPMSLPVSRRSSRRLSRDFEGQTCPESPPGPSDTNAKKPSRRLSKRRSQSRGGSSQVQYGHGGDDEDSRNLGTFAAAPSKRKSSLPGGKKPKKRVRVNSNDTIIPDSVIMAIQNQIGKSLRQTENAAPATSSIQLPSAIPAVVPIPVAENESTEVKNERGAHAIEDDDNPRKLKCICGYRAPSRSALFSHVKRQGTVEPRFRCNQPGCAKRFLFPSFVKNHLAKCHKVNMGNLMGCVKCYGLFSTRTQMDEHRNERGEICKDNPRRATRPDTAENRESEREVYVDIIGTSDRNSEVITL